MNYNGFGKAVKNIGFDDAVALGYKVQAPKRLTEQEKELCHRLGDGYHPTRIHCWNIAHRIIGDGWSAAVYPTAKGREYFVVELWSGHCSDCVARVHGLEFKDVERVLNLLERKYVEQDTAFVDADELLRDPALTVSVPGYQA